MNDPDFIEDLIAKRDKKSTVREFEEFFKFIFNTIKGGIRILDIDWKIIGVNFLFEKWFSHRMPFIGEQCYKNINYLIKPLINNLKSHLADEKGIHYIYSLEKTRRECLTIPKKIPSGT